MRLLSLQNKTESASALPKLAKGKYFGTLEVRCVHHPVSKIKAAERKRKRAFTGVCVIMFSVLISTVRRIVCPTMFLVSFVGLGHWWGS